MQRLAHLWYGGGSHPSASVGERSRLPQDERSCKALSCMRLSCGRVTELADMSPASSRRLTILVVVLARRPTWWTRCPVRTSRSSLSICARWTCRSGMQTKPRNFAWGASRRSECGQSLPSFDLCDVRGRESSSEDICQQLSPCSDSLCLRRRWEVVAIGQRP